MGLPDFKKSPVVEVALSIQFPPLKGVKNAHFMRLWTDVFRKDFPETEEQPPLNHVLERFGTPTPGNVRIQLEAGLPVPRYWFKNTDGTELVQVQRDRFIRNWRQLQTGKPYPRYEPLRKKFIKQFSKFTNFVEKEGMGKIEPDQCEVTYVNDLPDGEGWNSFGELGKVVTVWQSDFSDDFLPTPENIQFTTSFIIPGEGEKPVGRLHVAIEPRYQLPDITPLLRLSLTARGAPIGKGLDGVQKFMDLGREWVVKGFTSITTDPMHKIWERTSDR